MRPSALFARSRWALLASFAQLSLACGSSPGDGLFEKGSGVTPMGGTPSGGSSSGGGPASTGGVSQGGSSMGGAGAAGGSSGAASGGSAVTGGVASGGAATGGVASGGAATGGVASGGAATGGVASGGSAGSVSAQCTGFMALGHSYAVCNLMVGAPRARTACEAEGMRLAWIESAQENAALVQAIAGLGSSGPGAGVAEVYIGASDSEQEGQWRWGDGALFWQGNRFGMSVGGAYANWSTGRPNDMGVEDCAVMVVDMPSDGIPGQWNDTPCTEPHGALCEKP